MRKIMAITLVLVACGKKTAESPAPGLLPPPVAVADAPAFVRNLSLLYPDAELYRGPGSVLLQKTSHALSDIVRYYEEALKKHGFTETARLAQDTSALLQYERTEKDVKEMISVDLTRLPYTESYLIRIGRSGAPYSRTGAP
jgi:hypothetical protein